MALKKKLELESGVTVNHYDIEAISAMLHDDDHNTVHVNIQFNAYGTKKAKTDKKRPIFADDLPLRFKCKIPVAEFIGKDLKTLAGDILKTHPESPLKDGEDD